MDINSNEFGFYKESGEVSAGKCVEHNGKRYIELVKKFGSKNFELVTMRIPQYRSEKQDVFLKKMGRDIEISKNYRFHLMILNLKTDRYIDVSNGRNVYMDRTAYQMLQRKQKHSRANTDYKRMPDGQFNRMFEKAKVDNPGAPEIELIKAIVKLKWAQLGW
tara:strand:+ start:356 stop:841 length:486 start_codon:yes stop_codon:yes gene_type:complete